MRTTNSFKTKLYGLTSMEGKIITFLKFCISILPNNQLLRITNLKSVIKVTEKKWYQLINNVSYKHEYFHLFHYRYLTKQNKIFPQRKNLVRSVCGALPADDLRGLHCQHICLGWLLGLVLPLLVRLRCFLDMSNPSN